MTFEELSAEIDRLIVQGRETLEMLREANRLVAAGNAITAEEVDAA